MDLKTRSLTTYFGPISPTVTPKNVRYSKNKFKFTRHWHMSVGMPNLNHEWIGAVALNDQNQLLAFTLNLPRLESKAAP
jgi:hypothetical protein